MGTHSAGKVAGLEDRYTRRDFRDPAPPTTMRRIFLPALCTGFNLALRSDAEKLIGIVLGWSVSASHCVGSRDDGGDSIYVAKVVFHGLGVCRQADRIACSGSDAVTAQRSWGKESGIPDFPVAP